MRNTCDIELALSGQHFGRVPVRSISGVLRDLLDDAEREVLILTYRFMPDEFLINILSGLLKRGVRLKILIGILRKREHDALVKLNDLGASLFIFPESKGTMHAKLVMVDSSAAVLGSFNFTLMGTSRNHEIAMVIREREILTKLKRAVENLLTASVPLKIP